MAYLIAGMILFFGVHMLPNMGNARQMLWDGLGEKGYMPLYAGLSLVGFILIVYGMVQAPFIAVYQPPHWTRHITYLLMLIAVFSLVSRFVANNFRRLMFHPLLFAFAIWGLAHLLVNGDLASILLFGSFTVFGFFKIWSLNRRKPHPKPEKLPRSRDAIAVVVTLVVFVALMFGHPYFAGIPLF